MNLKDLTKEQRAELERQMREEALSKKQERKSYKELVNETVVQSLPALLDVSKTLGEVKKMVYENFDTLLNIKPELYTVKADQQTHTFTSKDGRISITIGHRVTDSYDDTVDEGIAKVKEYISSLARDKASSDLVTTILKLLSKDKKGNIKASRVIELEKIALDHDSESFIDGINIIKEASRPQKSCDFIEVKVRDEKGVERTIPLSISSVDIPE